VEKKSMKEQGKEPVAKKEYKDSGHFVN